MMDIPAQIAALQDLRARISDVAAGVRTLIADKSTPQRGRLIAKLEGAFAALDLEINAMLAQEKGTA